MDKPPTIYDDLAHLIGAYGSRDQLVSDQERGCAIDAQRFSELQRLIEIAVDFR